MSTPQPPQPSPPHASPLRPYAAGDAAALYDVCLRTADNGADATPRYADPALLGHIWVGPYLALEPELATVLDDGAGPQGYVVGALDTRAFEARCKREWWPALRREYPLSSVPAGSPDARIVDLLHHPSVAPARAVADHPAHLHINLLPRWQSGGWGRRLIETLLEALTTAGSPGVHLGVATTNARAIGFYERLGFSPLEDDAAGTLYLGRRLS